jgi:hypothetical protein
VATPARCVSGPPERIGYGVGVACVVLGGLVAAVAEPLQLDRGSWLAAYLVLVCGVAQSVMSIQQHLLATTPPARSWTWIVSWNSGNLLVIFGALARIPLLADLGGILLGCALAVALTRTRGANRRIRAILFRLAYVVLLASIPIGLGLTHLRAVPAG